MQARKQRRGLIGGAFWLGALATIAFYAVVLQNFMDGTTLSRYTTGHITEFVAMALFFWGTADLLLKMMSFRRERQALAIDWLPETETLLSPQAASVLYGQICQRHRELMGTLLGRRLERGLCYVREKRSADGIEEHLQYLAELEAEKAHAQYGLVRFVAWIIPILGFLGTVVHFTLAIANITPEQMERSLSTVTDGLAVAFDTTALALSLSMMMMFLIFLVEQYDRHILREVEHKTFDLLGHRFTAGDAATDQFTATLRAANESNRGHIRDLVDHQAKIWGQSLSAFEKQAEEATSRQLEICANMINAMHQQFEIRSRAQEERILRMLEALKVERTEQSKSHEQAADRVALLHQDLSRVAEQLTGLVAGEAKLLPMQQSLAENLKLLQRTQRMDEAVNGLTAAVHLMMARQQPYGSSETKAA